MESWHLSEYPDNVGSAAIACSECDSAPISEWVLGTTSLSSSFMKQESQNKNGSGLSRWNESRSA